MPEELKNKEKDFSVDRLKGLAILAVILGHIASPLTGFIFSWHMPLFFFVSGFFIKTDDSANVFLMKNVKRIMIYFFVFALLGFIVTYFRDFLLGRENESIVSGLLGIFFWMDMEHLNHYGFVLWFLPALFWGKSVNYFLLKYVKNKLIIGLLISILFYLAVISRIELPFVLDIGIISSLWIFMGYIFYNFLRDKIVKYWYYFVGIIPVVLLLSPVPGLNLSLRFLSIPWYNVLYSSMVIVFLFALFSKASYNNRVNDLLAYIGKNSMFLFIFHTYTNNIAYIIVNKFFGDFWYLKFILSFTLVYIFLIFYRKYLNKGILKYV